LLFLLPGVQAFVILRMEEVVVVVVRRPPSREAQTFVLLSMAVVVVAVVPHDGQEEDFLECRGLALRGLPVETSWTSAWKLHLGDYPILFLLAIASEGFLAH
jgi:hypothetical protein